MYRRIFVKLVVIALMVGCLATDPPAQVLSSAGAAEVTSPRQNRTPARDAAAAVTLITGDKVHIKPANGSWDVRVEPAPGHSLQIGGFLQRISPAGVTVIPIEAAALVRTGVLDRRLFDITELVQQGFDDTHRKSLPLLVQARGGRSARATAERLGTVTRELPQSGFAVVEAPKSRNTFDRLIAGASSLRKIWLNSRAHLSLDRSAAQVGAPKAWRAGFSGLGATVAVLDTGYDSTHPDLSGVVKDSRDFTGDPAGTQDLVGHGTHVASIVAGRGSARPDHRFTGIAKDANLLIGKVCQADGCPYDLVIAGMQWAAQSGARVVNLSLESDSTDGTDPLSTELNRLSRQFGTLFVVAAGNHFDQVVSPAAADEALAVGSVTKNDAVSTFSATGPRSGDAAMKPDLVAPGEGIIAARANGTDAGEPVGDLYTRMSGTSMAAPHVAGAAAILSAQHPAWRAGELKAALMNTAHPVPGSVYRQGAGRLDIARAVTQQVTASPAALSFGNLVGDGRKSVTYRNTGRKQIALSIKVKAFARDGGPAPAGMFAIDRDRITIPPDGEVSVTVAANARLGSTGPYAGRLVATGSHGIQIQTIFGLTRQAPIHNVDVRMIGRDGRPALPNSQTIITDLDDPDGYDSLYFVEHGDEVLRLPAGRYAAAASVFSVIPGQWSPAMMTVAEPEFAVTGDRRLVMDGRGGQPVGLQVERPDAQISDQGVGIQITHGQTSYGLRSGTHCELYAVPTKGSHPELSYFFRAQVDRPPVALAVTAPEKFQVPVETFVGIPLSVGAHELTAIDVGHAGPEDIAGKDLQGRLAVFTLDQGEAKEFSTRVNSLGAAGAAAAVVYFAAPTPVHVGSDSPLPVVTAFGPQGRRLARLASIGATVAWQSNAPSPYHYDLAFPGLGGIPAGQIRRPRDEQLGRVRADYHSQGDGETAEINDVPEIGSFEMDPNFRVSEVELGRAQARYYSPTPVTWTSSMSTFTAQRKYMHRFAPTKASYKAGDQVIEEWNKPVFGPALPGASSPESVPFTRDGNTIEGQLPLFSDSAGRAGSADTDDEGDTSLFMNGRLIGHSGVPGSGIFPVPAEPADYSLTAAVKRNREGWALSTEVEVEWKFRSAEVDRPTALPLLTIGFDPELDLRDYAPAGARFLIPVAVRRQPGSAGSAARPVSVDVSYDDGASWSQADLVKSNSGWTAGVTHPARSTFVSLRATATDAQGNKMTEVIMRAYRTH